MLLGEWKGKEYWGGGLKERVFTLFLNSNVSSTKRMLGLFL